MPEGAQAEFLYVFIELVAPSWMHDFAAPIVPRILEDLGIVSVARNGVLRIRAPD